MASVRSRSHHSEKEEEGFRNWRSPHHKSSDPFRQREHQQGGRRDREHGERYSRYDHVHGGMDNKSGSHRTRYRESRSHRWSDDRRTSEQNWKMDLKLKSSTEFPVLGTNVKETNTSYTPEAIRPSVQRHTSTSSTNWADRIEQFEKDKERALKDMMRYKRRLLMSESSDCSNEDQENHKVNMNAEPKKEYETDETIIVRRQKQIDYGKNTLGYDNYLQEIPKSKRVKGKHMSTPNKFHKCSRRAWEGLVRQWRKKLHEYDPEDGYKPDRLARKELQFSDSTSDTSSVIDGKMDIDLNNSLSSTVSDYLASNESSCPQTPDTVSRPQTPTIELKSLSVSDHFNENHPVGSVETPTLVQKKNKATPDATLTPSVTPADHEGQNNNFPPQVNPGDLMAALHHAAQMQPRSYVTPMNPVSYNLNVHGPRPQMIPNFIPERSTCSLPVSHDNANKKMAKEKKDDIFVNFNLDDCFKNDKNVVM